jgi:hypothetical protein
MSRRYQALQKSGGLPAFDPDSSTNGMLDAGWGLPKIPASSPRDITQAVVDLLHHKRLTHSFGVQREWEVRTTLIANRQAWRYRSCVFVHGKKAGKGFPSIDGDQTRQIRLAEAVSEDIRAAFAREAVEVHVARCTSVAEHIRMASLPSPPRRWHARMKTMALVLCGVVALVTAYWLWKGSERLRPGQPHSNQPQRITPTPLQQPDAKVMQGTADFHDAIANARLPEAAGVVDDAAALDAAVDVRNAHAAARDAPIRRIADRRSGRTTPPRPAPAKALKPTPPGRAAPPDCFWTQLRLGFGQSGC